jgi:hypothetical protein
VFERMTSRAFNRSKSIGVNGVEIEATLNQKSLKARYDANLCKLLLMQA